MKKSRVAALNKLKFSGCIGHFILISEIVAVPTSIVY